MHYTHLPTLPRLLSLAQSHYHTTRRSISTAPHSLGARVTRCWHSCLFNSKRSTTRLFRVKNLWDDGLDYEFDYSERDLFGEEGEGVVDQVQTGFEDGEGAMRVGSEVPLVLGHEEGGDWFGDNGDEGDSTEAVVDGGDDSDRLGPDYNVFCRVEAMKAAYASQCYWGVMGREMVP